MENQKPKQRQEEDDSCEVDSPDKWLKSFVGADDVFRRRDSIQRTPDKADLEKEESKKRSREGSEEIDERKKTRKGDVSTNPEEAIHRSMEDLCKKMDELERLIGDNVNTKKEIKTTAKQMARLLGRMKYQMENQKTRPKLETCEAATQTEDSRVITATKDTATQVSEKVTKVEVDKEGDEGTWEGTRILCEKDWEREAYLTRVLRGNPTVLAGNADVMIMYDPQGGHEGINATKTDTIKEVIEMNRIRKGELGRIQNRMEVMFENDVISKGAGRTTILAALNRDEEEDYKLLRDAKEKMLHEESRLVILVDPRVLNNKFRKIMECALRGAAREILIYDMDTKLDEEGARWSSVLGAKKQKAPAVIIKEKGKTYEEILRNLRANITGDNVPKGIRNMRKSKAGDLIVEMEDLDGTRLLKEAVSRTSAEADIKVVAGNKRMLHIYDVDAVTTAAEVVKALEGTIGDGKAEVRSLRPMAGGRQVATVEVDEDAEIENLTGQGLKIGWTKCRIRERVDVVRCFRCGGINHIARNCKETPIGERCRRCGGEGHKAAECTNKDFCWTCKKAGHKNASFKCPIFRQTVNNGTRERPGQL